MWGGDDDDENNNAPPSTSVQEGVFLDSAVEGIEYKTPTQSGITDINGTFKYKKGEIITFSIGDVILGQTSAIKKITPVNIVSGAADEMNNKVTNISCFLQSLDVDKNPNNGIKLTQDIRDEINGRSIDFDVDTNVFKNNIQGLFDTLNQKDGVFTDDGRTLCSANQAQAHLRATLLECLAGGYSGTYSGGDNGSWSMTVNSAGNISGTAQSAVYKEKYSVLGTMASSGSMTLAIGMVSSGSTFRGKVDSSGNVQGTWENLYDSINGEFTGNKK